MDLKKELNGVIDNIILQGALVEKKTRDFVFNYDENFIAKNCDHTLLKTLRTNKDSSLGNISDLVSSCYNLPNPNLEENCIFEMIEQKHPDTQSLSELVAKNFNLPNTDELQKSLKYYLRKE